MRIRVLVTALLLILTPAHLLADQIYPLEPPDTISPRNTYQYFIEQMTYAYNAHLHSSYHSTDVENFVLKAMKCIDLSEIPKADRKFTGVETALLLKEVLDRIPTPPVDEIPDATAVQENQIDFYVLPHTPIRIVRMTDGPRKGEYLFSKAVVEDAMEFYNQTKHLPYKPGSSIGAYEDYLSQPGPLVPKALIRHLPQWMTFRVWGASLWQFLSLLFGLFMIGTIVFILNRFVRVDEAQKTANYVYWTLRKLLIPFALIMLLILFKYFAEEQVSITGQGWIAFKHIARIFILFVVVWAIFNVTRGITEGFISSKHIKQTGIDPNILRMLFRLGSIILILLVLWNASEYFGVSLTAVFASAGIIGMAIAFAAQQTLANLLGGASLLMDRPFKAGDYITLDTGERGMVMDVGLRSTRIMTRDDIQITIPNSIVASSKIVNESAPTPEFRVRLQVGVAYDADLAKAQALLLKVASEERLVKKNPSPTVRIRGFGESAVNFELLCRAYWSEEKGKLIHRLYWGIFRAFQDAGIVIPFPQRDVHVHEASRFGADKAVTPKQP